MDIYVLDTNFTVVKILDTFSSFIWTDRYNLAGDFEIYTDATLDMIKNFPIGYYLWIEDSEHVMIIDEVVIVTDIESGSRLMIRGQSLEIMLNDRIVWQQTTLTGNFQNAIRRLLNDAIISPSLTARRISNFKFQASTDSRITALTINSQFTGTSLYEAITDLCIERNVGFRIVLNESNEFVFSLYMGDDRSYDQTTNPYVIFSPTFDNIVNSNYLESNKNLKNVALIAGEGEGLNRTTVAIGSGSGINRKELYVDARDISSTVYGDDGTEQTEIPMAEYLNLLRERGKEKMADYEFTRTFEGEVETTQMFIYKRDFFIGDIVQIENEFGLDASARIAEIIFSNDENGNLTVPTFEIIS